MAAMSIAVALMAVVPIAVVFMAVVPIAVASMTAASCVHRPLDGQTLHCSIDKAFDYRQTSKL